MASQFDYEIVPTWMREAVYALKGGARPDTEREDMPGTLRLVNAAEWDGVKGIPLEDVVVWIALNCPVNFDKHVPGDMFRIADDTDLGAWIGDQFRRDAPPYTRLMKFSGTGGGGSPWKGFVCYLDIGENDVRHPKNSTLVRQRKKK